MTGNWERDFVQRILHDIGPDPRDHRIFIEMLARRAEHYPEALDLFAAAGDRRRLGRRLHLPRARRSRGLCAAQEARPLAVIASSAAVDSMLFVSIAFGSLDVAAGNTLGKFYASAAAATVLGALAARRRPCA